MTTTIDVARAAPGDVVTCKLTGAPFDLTKLQRARLLVALQEVAPGSALSWVASQVTLLDAATLTFVVPGAPGSGGLPIRNGGKRVVLRYGLWQDRATTDLEIVGGAATPPGAPGTPAPQPPAGGVHHLRVTPDRAGPGQEITAELFDGSLDFTSVSTAQLSVWLTVVGTGAAINYRAPSFRVVDRRTLAFVVPPVAPGGLQPGDYLVVMRYGFWEGRGQRGLRVFASATPPLPGAVPLGPRSAARVGPPSLALPLPTWALGVGWPAPLASSAVGRPVVVQWALLALRAPFRVAIPTAPLAAPSVRAVPVIPMPVAAMPVLMPIVAPSPPAPLKRPVPAIVPAGTTPANLAAVCRGQVRDRISAFFALNARATTDATSVRPLVDGEQIVPALADLIASAERYLYLAWWAIDARLRLGVQGQHTAKDVPWEHDALVGLIKHRAANLMARGDNLDVKILVWDHPLDDESELGSTALEPLLCCMVPWGTIRSFKVDTAVGRRALLGTLRAAPHYSVAPARQLLEVFSVYANRDGLLDATLLPFPSGLAVATQEHDVGMTGSHHQKLLVTERAAFIGGFNLLHEYWDTRKHLVGDTRRFQAPSALFLGASGGFMSAGASTMLHDTGAIVCGPVVNQALEGFALRWDQAVDDGRCHRRLIGVLNGHHLKDLVRDLDSQAERDRQRISQTRAIDGVDRVARKPDPSRLVDDAIVVASLPSSTPYGPVEDIRTCYLRAIGALASAEAYAYFETQYFDDYGLAKRLYQQWRTQRRYQGERAPFAHLVLPYNPSTAWLDEVFEDITEFFQLDLFLFDREIVRKVLEVKYSERLATIEAEFKMLRWLEIMTARRIYVRGDGQQPWEGRFFDIKDPVRQIKWSEAALERSPKTLTASSEFSIVSESDPNVEICDDLEAGSVMTLSDIEAFCVVGGETPRLAPGGYKAIRDHLLTHEVYIHSKAAAFLDREKGLAYATVGSANLNQRSLGNEGAQDSELNLWWKGLDSVDRFWRDLGAEHTGLDPANLTPRGLAAQGWDNFRALFRGKALTGRVVRLDVADRFEHQKTRT